MESTTRNPISLNNTHRPSVDIACFCCELRAIYYVLQWNCVLVLWTGVHRHIQLSINSNDYKWHCEIVTIRNSSTCTKREEARERDKYICSSHILNFCLEWRKNNRMRFLHHKRGNKITIWNGDTQMFEFNRSQAGDWRLKAAESGS